ncbi:hypothetical protein HC251_21015 [Iamia sp. SCSIO 61187]|uniref:type II secretion system F family protein n=1 Tax=Iamia sp. SCSIO 61187 TaxID=2722752 RepID=UPI001C62A38D|nr:type II secretion system F family protein [Iamia sp. SCSIO 61187]QYG94670.1 hypothetical protein HC251_21015 [Iamia sp. SCSIO 61187]
MSAALVLAGGLGAVGCVAVGRRPAADRRPRPPAGRRTARLPAWWSEALVEAGVDGDPARWARLGLGSAGLLGLLAGSRGGVVGGLVAAGVAVVVGGVALRMARGRGARQADARLPELVEHVGRGLRAGLDLRSAVLGAGAAVGGPHGAALEVAVARVDGGAGWGEALEGWVDDHPRRSVQLVVGALAVADAAGGRASRALDGVAATLRARAAVADEARALASQARASAAVLVALPVVVAAGGAAADRAVARALLGTPWGLGCIGLATALDVVGALWMHRIVSRARS